MSSVTSSWRQRRQASRTRRALAAAVARTSSPAMRDELLTLANSSQFTNILRLGNTPSLSSLAGSGRASGGGRDPARGTLQNVAERT